MAIVWKDGKTTHKGLVVFGRTKSVQRVMSDIYSDVWTCTVWCPKERIHKSVTVNMAFELFQNTGSETVDILNGEYSEEYKSWQKEMEEKRVLAEIRKEEERKKKIVEDAKEKSLRPMHGRKCRTVRGRKVKIGTEGEIFYLRQTEWGVKIGFKDSDGEAHWTWVEKYRSSN